MQEQHDLADDLLVSPAGDDTPGPLGADPRHFMQPLRLLLDQVEHCLAERAHQLTGINRADAADHAGAEVFLDPFQGCRRCDLEEDGLELQAMGAVVDPDTAHLHPFARAYARGMADHGDKVPLAADLHPQHTEAGLVIVVGHPFHQACQCLYGRGAGRRGWGGVGFD